MPTPLTNPTIEQRVNDLLGQMTLEEKVGQTNQLIRLTEVDRDEVRKGRVGSSIFATTAWAGKDNPTPADAATSNEFQRIAVTESRLGIPLLLARDVIHHLPLQQFASNAPLESGRSGRI